MGLEKWQKDRLRELVKLEQEALSDLENIEQDALAHPAKLVTLKRKWERAARRLSNWFRSHGRDLWGLLEHE